MTSSIKLLVFAGLIGLLALPAGADFSPVYDNTNEDTVFDVFGHFFPGISVTGTDTGTEGAAHTSYDLGGGITATRIDDFNGGGQSLGTPLDLLTGGPGFLDGIWSDGLATFTAEAKFAVHSQQFGYETVLGNGMVDYIGLFSTSGSGYSDGGLSGDLNTPTNFSGTWAWARDGNEGPWSSEMAENSDGEDHMITYLIDDPSTDETIWWVFFEDLDGLGDTDYNDLVVEIRAVPLPGAVVLGVVGLGLVCFLRRRFAA